MIDSVVRRTVDLRSQLTNPYSATLWVVTMMPILSAIALGSVLWRPLGYVAAVISLFYVRKLHRAITSGLASISPGAPSTTLSQVKSYVVIALLAAVLSIPVVQVFFRGDLAAMAAPTVVAQLTDGWQGSFTPEAIYGSTASLPSYTPCQFIQSWTAPTAASSCYSAVGYLRLWRMPTALPMLVSLTMIYILFPLTLARLGRSNK